MRDNEKVGNILELPVPFWKIKVENTRLLAEKVDQGKIARISIVNGLSSNGVRFIPYSSSRMHFEESDEKFVRVRSRSQKWIAWI